MAVMYLSDLEDHLQKKVLEKHPEFHSYDWGKQIDVLRKAVHQDKKNSGKVVKAVRKSAATREVAESLDKPEGTPVAKPAEKARRIASTTQSSADAPVVQFRPPSEIRAYLRQAGTSESSEHANKLMNWAGQMEDHLSTYGVQGSDNTDSANQTSNSDVEPKHVRVIRQHLAKFYDAIHKHNEFHTKAEYPGGTERTSSVIGGKQREVGARPGARDASTAVDPVTALANRPLAKEFLKMASQHLGEAADEFKKHFSSSDVIKGVPSGLDVKDAIAAVAHHYSETNLGKVTGNIQGVARQVMMTQAQRDAASGRRENKTSGLHYDQLTDEAKADLDSKHPNFDSYPETDEQARVFSTDESGNRAPSKDSVLREYQATGQFKSNQSGSQPKFDLTHYQELLKRRTPEEAFAGLVRGVRNARSGMSVDKSIGNVESQESKVRLAKERENAPEEDPNAKDKFGFTEQQHYDAFEAAHHHFMANNRGDYKTYLKSTAYTHPAAYLADNLTPQKRGGRGGSMSAFRGED